MGAVLGGMTGGGLGAGLLAQSAADFAAWGPIIVALIAGPVSIWVSSRVARKPAERAALAAQQAAESIGPRNGHGTMQDQGAQILHRLDSIEGQQRTMQTGMDSVVQAASTVGQRLKAHDREFAAHRKRLDALEEVVLPARPEQGRRWDVSDDEVEG